MSDLHTPTYGKINWHRPPPSIPMVPGLARTELPHADQFEGSAEKLVLSGLVQMSQLPGQPGRPKTAANYRPADVVREPGESWHRVPGYLAIYRRGNDTYRLQLTVSRADQIQRDPVRHSDRLVVAARLDYSQYWWGDCITGPKEKLQALGIAIAMPFPGEPGGPRRVLRATDPRGLEALITRDYDGLRFCARIEFPGRTSFSTQAECWADVAGGVQMRQHGHWNEFLGAPDALVMAGLVKDGQWPGAPGMRKIRVTILPNGRVHDGPPQSSHPDATAPGAKWVERRANGMFCVSVRVAEDEGHRRRNEWHQEERLWQGRMDALPRPRPLKVLSPDEIGRRRIAADAARADLTFQGMLSGLLARRTWRLDHSGELKDPGDAT